MMSLSKEQAAFTLDIARLIEFAYSIGVSLTFGEAYRTAYQQKEYLRTGRSRTMKSNHLRRLAVDFNFFIDGKLYYNHEKIVEIGNFWEGLNEKNRWGGHFKTIHDTPHFERNV